MTRRVVQPAVRRLTYMVSLARHRVAPSGWSSDRPFVPTASPRPKTFGPLPWARACFLTTIETPFSDP